MVWIIFLLFGFRDNGIGDGCKILNWDYPHLASMNFNDAIMYVQSRSRPDVISCRDRVSSYYHYEQEPGASIVPEVRIF